MAQPVEIFLRLGYPEFRDLPWNLPLSDWAGHCSRLEKLPIGLSRHPVLFVNYDQVVYSLKELSTGLAFREFESLVQMTDLHLPVVSPIGYVQTKTKQGVASVLITRYLDNSLPFRMLFMGQMRRYSPHLLDAIAGLLVELHLGGVFWGDCSLSNALFRRDAGVLRAYLVDAETSEFHPDFFPPELRLLDLQIMEENVKLELMELPVEDSYRLVQQAVMIKDIGGYIHARYLQLWEEITREEIISSNEKYQIQDRIRSLNDLGFSVGNVHLEATPDGDRLRLRILVTDRNFHHNQLYDLTGLDVEEMQARKMMNEIQGLRATLSQSNSRDIPLNAAAFHWLENVYSPVMDHLNVLVDQNTTSAELYCQLLEHKWYMSEMARHDVGHFSAVEDYIIRFGESTTTK